MKLISQDLHDNHLISCLIQNSITTLDNIKWDKNSFKIKITRFCWEDYLYNHKNFRTVSVLKFFGVKKIQGNLKYKYDFLDLLSFTCKTPNQIQLIFQNNLIFRLIGRNIKVVLNDITDKWLQYATPDNHFNDQHL